MEFFLATATVLGGIAAIWYFWDKLGPRIRSTPLTTAPIGATAPAGISPANRALIENVVQELQFNQGLMNEPKYATTPALRVDAWLQLQPGAIVPTDLRAQLQGIYNEIGSAKDIHHTIENLPAKANPIREQIQIEKHLGHASAAIPSAIEGLHTLLH
jgi:hypothetical protein